MKTKRLIAGPAAHMTAPARPREGRAKVLLFYPDFGAIGGIERMLHQTAVELNARDQFEAVMVCSEGTPFQQALQASDIRTHGVETAAVFGNPNLRWLDFSTRAQLKCILRAEQPDLVHVHIGGPENLLFKDLGYPVIYTLHGYGTLYSVQGRQPTLKKLAKSIYKPAFKNALSRMDAVIVVSEAERTRLSAEGYLPDGLQSRIIYNGLPVQSFIERARAYPELTYEKGADECCNLSHTLPLPGKNARYVSFIDRIDANKNPFQFIELAEFLSIQPGFEDLFYLVAGKGPLEEALCQRIAGSPVKGKIHFIGHTDEVPYVLSVSDLVVHIPTMEGFGLGVLEAMAVGTPVLAYASGGIPEVLGDLKDCMVPTGDFEALKQQAVRLLSLNNGERHALAHRMQARAWMFDVSATMQRLEEVYRDVLGRP